MEVVLKKVYAIIVSWNGTDWICAALDSLRQSTFPVQVVVIDNASTDETVNIIQELYPEVKLFCLSHNSGFGKANNQAIRYELDQGADYVLLLNQDAKVDYETIGMLVNVFENYPDYGIVSPIHLEYQGTDIDSIFFKFINSDIRLISDAFSGKLEEIYEVPFVPAAVWLLSRQAFERVGGFDPIFFMYGEDRDYCDRVRFHGLKVGVATNVFAYHWHDQHNGKISRTFRTQSILMYGTILYELTRPGHNFFCQLGSTLLQWLREIIIELLYSNFKGFSARLLALSMSFLNIRRIWRCHVQIERNWRERNNDWL